MSNRILVIEDEDKIRQFIQRGLTYEDYRVDVAADGPAGLALARENPPDIVVLDWMLKGMDGLEVCRRLRAAGPVPILMLTAKDTVADRVMGLDAGADDYLVKPFAFDELLARLRALARRGPVGRPALLAVGDLRVDPAARRVWRGEDEVVLTAQEFALLHTLAMRPGRVLSREQLVHLAWDSAYEQHSNVVDVCVRGLRERIDRPYGRHSVQTVRGYGYRLAEDPP